MVNWFTTPAGFPGGGKRNKNFNRQHKYDMRRRNSHFFMRNITEDVIQINRRRNRFTDSRKIVFVPNPSAPLFRPPLITPFGIHPSIAIASNSYPQQFGMRNALNPQGGVMRKAGWQPPPPQHPPPPPPHQHYQQL
eukprot:GHVL01019700.1.p4 GENE.GHVL01019700.1~~GHVL01019700.1.p4  ORF type:complete len:136 (+),score=35.97 GHVL01019700.1:706-1113(+)